MTKVRVAEPAEHDRCAYCGYRAKTKAEHERHEAGLDSKWLECPHQDIDAIKLREKSLRVGAYERRPTGCPL
jgi:hypothetical protein